MIGNKIRRIKKPVLHSRGDCMVDLKTIKSVTYMGFW
jgi:hypothetical protein